MTILEQASYSHHDVEIEKRESLYQGFTRLEKSAFDIACLISKNTPP